MGEDRGVSLYSFTACGMCDKPLPCVPLHGDKGGPLVCSFCAGKWQAKYSRRRKWGRIVVKALKAYFREGGGYGDVDKLKLAAMDVKIAGLDTDTLGVEIGDITSELLADTLQLVHPDRHPPERHDMAKRVTQDLLALKPFTFPAPKPPAPPKPRRRDDSAKVSRDTGEDPLQITYPCEDCALTVPYYYCTSCSAEWEERQAKERERDNARQREQYARRAQRRRTLRRRTKCGGCGEDLNPELRKDAKYCSGVCRQRAHRLRKGQGGPEVAIPEVAKLFNVEARDVREAHG